MTRGFQNKNYYDQSEIYSPVIKLADFRFLISVANKYNLHVHQMDVKTAFLNGELKQKVYMSIPDGVAGKDKLQPEYVCELKKSLYGLKISPKKWYEKFKDEILKLGFTTYPFQPCLFFWRNQSSFVIVGLYVDDLLIVGNNLNKIKNIKVNLNKVFEMVDLKEPKLFLGIEIVRDPVSNFFFLKQTKFVEKLLKRFDLNNCNPCRTPCITNESERKGIKRKLDTFTNSEICKIPFRQAVGSLLYLASGTRPDLTFVVNKISRNQSNYTPSNWMEIKRVFRYLAGTKNLGLKFESKGKDLECFVDASLGTNDELGKSTTGLIICLFGDPIHWKTKKQSHVALSTMEAEYIAMSLAAKELTSLKEMCKRLIKFDTIPIMYKDNIVAIKVAKTEESQSLKHVVNLCYHYIRHEVAHKNLIIKWIRSENQLGDLFTKALGNEKFLKFRTQILSSLN